MTITTLCMLIAYISIDLIADRSTSKRILHLEGELQHLWMDLRDLANDFYWDIDNYDEEELEM